MMNEKYALEIHCKCENNTVERVKGLAKYIIFVIPRFCCIKGFFPIHFPFPYCWGEVCYMYTKDMLEQVHSDY